MCQVRRTEPWLLQTQLSVHGPFADTGKLTLGLKVLSKQKNGISIGKVPGQTDVFFSVLFFVCLFLILASKKKKKVLAPSLIAFHQSFPTITIPEWQGQQEDHQSLNCLPHTVHIFKLVITVKRLELQELWVVSPGSQGLDDGTGWISDWWFTGLELRVYHNSELFYWQLSRS